MLFVLAFISIFSSSAYSQILPFEEVSIRADAIIARMDANEQVDSKEVKEVSHLLIEYVVSNLGKDAERRRAANLFISEEDMKNSVFLKERNIREIRTVEYRTFIRSMDYLKRIPMEFWGEDLVDRLDAVAYAPKGFDKENLTKSYDKISLMNIAVELSDINTKQTLPDYFLDFFSCYYYNSALVSLSYINIEDDIAGNYDQRLLLKDDIKKLFGDITAYYARLILVEDFVDKGYVGRDLKAFSDKIDLDKYFGDIEAHKINGLYGVKKGLVEIINSLSEKKYFDPLRYEEGEADHHKKAAERIASKKRANAHVYVFNVSDKLNAYLPEHLRSTCLDIALDNFALYVAGTLDGVLGEKEDILLFGDYTEGGRMGGIFGKMVAMKQNEMITLFGALAYVNGFCENREVLMTVNDGFKMAGIMSYKGVLNREKFDKSLIEKRFDIKFSYGMTRRFNKGVDLIKM